MKVISVRSAREKKRFVDVPWRLHEAGGSPWIPPLRTVVADLLDAQDNPFYRMADRELFLAVEGDRTLGRIAAIENRAHNEFHGDRVGFFGFFECREDQNVADALFDAAAGWLRERGLRRMRGPVNPSTNHEAGLLVEGFEHPPTILTPWTPPYYVGLCEEAGLEGVKDLLAYRFLLDRFELPERWTRLAEVARGRKGITFRDLDLRRFDREVESCWEIYNSAWEKNWGFVPLRREEFAYQARKMKPLLIPEFSFVAEVEGEPAGFLFILPDFNPVFEKIGDGRLFPLGWLRILLAKRRIRFGRILALGVKPEYRTRSIFPLFAQEMYRRGREYGAAGVEASWVLDDNEAVNAPLRKLGARVYRRWRIYERSL